MRGDVEQTFRILGVAISVGRGGPGDGGLRLLARGGVKPPRRRSFMETANTLSSHAWSSEVTGGLFALSVTRRPP